MPQPRLPAGAKAGEEGVGVIALEVGEVQDQPPPVAHHFKSGHCWTRACSTLDHRPLMLHQQPKQFFIGRILQTFEFRFIQSFLGIDAFDLLGFLDEGSAIKVRSLPDFP